MTLKIDTYVSGRRTVVRLTGRLQAEHVAEIKAHIIDAPVHTALDLESVTLVDLQVIQFFNDLEESGIELLNCCPYIREWMLREREQTTH